MEAVKVTILLQFLPGPNVEDMANKIFPSSVLLFA